MLFYWCAEMSYSCGKKPTFLGRHSCSTSTLSSFYQSDKLSHSKDFQEYCNQCSNGLLYILWEGLQRSLTDWHLLLIEQEKTDSPHLPSRQFIQRRPAAPPAAPSKNLVFNPVSNQMASMNALFSPSHSAALLQGLSSASVSGGDATRATRSLMNDVNGHRNLRAGNTNWTRVNHHDFNLRRKSFSPHWNAWKCHSYFLAPTHPEQQQDFL